MQSKLIYANTTEVGRETMVLHEGSRNPHTSVMENCKEPYTNVEHKNHTQMLNTENHKLMKPYGKQYINTPID